MVDIVIVAQTIFQMHVIVNGSKDIFFCDMLRNQLVDLTADCVLDILNILILFQYLSQNRIVHKLCHSHLSGINVHIVGDIHHHAGKDFDVALFTLDPYIGNCRVLDLVSQFF